MSAYEGFKANGNKNGYGVYPKLLSTGHGDTMYDYQDGIDTPGFFHRIPFCDMKTFVNNWYREGGALRGVSKALCDDYLCCENLK